MQKHIERSENSQVSLKGTPACSGDVIARACVITDLKDIDQLTAGTYILYILQQLCVLYIGKQTYDSHLIFLPFLGDVLITYTTDVGWSPYFPILSAVVTELGGLISHGRLSL